MTTTIKKLNDHKHAQCHVQYDNSKDFYVFWSYNTPVITVKIYGDNEPGLRGFTCFGTYSPTTRKQIGYFLKEYFPDITYQDMKSIVGMGEVIM